MDKNMNESPDTIHGRMKEGAHIAGYSLQRSIENLRWLLEDSRFEQLSAGYKDVNEFLRDSDKAFKLLNIDPKEREQIAKLVKELQPKASQRAIADMVGVSGKTIDRDLGYKDAATNVANEVDTTGEENSGTATNVAPTFPPAIPPDDYDLIKLTQGKRLRDIKREQLRVELEDIKTQEIKAIMGIYDVIVIDPPWPIEKIERDVALNQTAFDYPTMEVDEIAELDIPAADDCHLFLWTTHKYLPDALMILRAWGFKYTCTFTWHKPGGFQPYNFPQLNCEFILYARMGNPQFIDQKNFMACFYSKRSGHSIKPDEFYKTIARVTAGRRLDMFNRREISGFDGWGNESPNR